MNTILQKILDHMAAKSLTIYQVSNMLREKIPQRTVYSYLTGEKETSTKNASIIMQILNLKIVHDPTLETLNQKESAKMNNEQEYDSTKFQNDDKGYLKWLSDNPSGYVINSYSEPSPEYLVLHKASCGTISTPTRENWTTTGFIKICSNQIENLTKWAQVEIEGKVTRCGICKP